MTDREREARIRERGTTHWEGCWRSHPRCGEARVEKLEARVERYREALERVVVECGSDLMSCDCAPPKQGEACSRCEIEYVARTALEDDTGGRERE